MGFTTRVSKIYYRGGVDTPPPSPPGWAMVMVMVMVGKGVRKVKGKREGQESV